MYIFQSGLRSLGLHSLTSVSHGRVLIAQNEHLCFVDTIDWGSITNHRSRAFVIRHNNANCGKFVTLVCSFRCCCSISVGENL